MKYLISILLLFPSFIIAQTYNAKLIDYTDDKTPAYCGYSIAYGILKLELQENIKNLKKGDTIFVFQECPREAMEMSVGKYINYQLYSLTLLDEINENSSQFGIALRIYKKDYPNDKPKNFWQGMLGKLQ